MSQWEEFPLGDLLVAINGKSKVQRGWSPQCLSEPAQSEETWAVLKTTAIQMGSFEPQHNKALPTKLEPKRHLEVEPGDFLMTTTGPRNRCGVICLVSATPRRLIFSGKILRFKVDASRLESRWLQYLLQSTRFQNELDSLKVGTSESSVSIGNDQILSLMIPVPSITEQKLIVEILDNQLYSLEKSKSNLSDLKVLLNSLTRSLLHNKVSCRGTRHSLAELCTLITDGSHFSPKTVERGFPYITVRDLQNNGIDFKNCKYITEASFLELERSGCSPKPGDILFSKDGTVGKVALVSSTEPFAVLSSLAILRPNLTLITPEFLKLSLRSPVVLEQALGMKSGTAIRRVVLRTLKTLEIVVPSLDEQESIVKFINTELSKVASMENLLDRLMVQQENLRKSILHAAITGQLKKEN